MPIAAKRYIYGVIAAGALVLALALTNWSSPHPLEWALYLALAVLASIPKLRLPGMTATYSLNFWLLLFGVVHFSLPETLDQPRGGHQTITSASPTRPRASYSAGFGELKPWRSVAQSRMVRVFDYGSSSAVSGFSGAYARRRACVGRSARQPRVCSDLL